MKIFCKTKSDQNLSSNEFPNLNAIHIIMHLHPVIYDNSQVVLGSIVKKGNKYYTSFQIWR